MMTMTKLQRATRLMENTTDIVENMESFVVEVDLTKRETKHIKEFSFVYRQVRYCIVYYKQTHRLEYKYVALDSRAKFMHIYFTCTSTEFFEALEEYRLLQYRRKQKLH